MYFSDNRSKQAEEFGDWLKDAFGTNEKKLNEYLELHSIPVNKENWYTDKFEEFIEERRKLIFEKINKLI